MRVACVLRFVAVCALTGTAMPPSRAEPLTIDQFRSEMLGVPLCGTPASGPLQNKAVCVVHLPDGNVVVAGAGVLVRGLWDADGDRICRRAAGDPLERRRCVSYERIADSRYRNSDGVEVCVGPCPMP